MVLQAAIRYSINGAAVVECTDGNEASGDGEDLCLIRLPFSCDGALDVSVDDEVCALRGVGGWGGVE